ncbi:MULTISPECIES: hypothetical protein [Streptomycetaceae]|uniref:hypothetical protein n=1 Tax=Streptomycetaceae TaxID=2062 RepID=UPI0002EE50A0|nr:MULTISPECIES: hypothetical protein [Streptomycetaceae]MYS58825.1 hypothetical protein [Streptomyces sp. SID5468]
MPGPSCLESADGAGDHLALGVLVFGQFAGAEDEQRHPRDAVWSTVGQGAVPRQTGYVEVDVRQDLPVGADGAGDGKRALIEAGAMANRGWTTSNGCGSSLLRTRSDPSTFLRICWLWIW